MLAQALLWSLLAFIFIAHLPLTLGFPIPKEYWLKQTFLLLLLMGVYYLNAKILVPKLFRKQKRAYFLVLHATLILGMQVVSRLIDYQFGVGEILKAAIETGMGAKLNLNLRGWTNLDASLLLTTIMIICISTVIAIVQIWQEERLHSQQMQQKQLDAELSFLKAQIHPHFFFNTLNNIYALTFIDVEISRTSLHKLSRMMRYLLYETQNNVTFLSKEVNFVKDYIELMQLRMSEFTTVNLEAPATFTDHEIAPMLLLPFIENAFKHGVSTIHQSRIDIVIQQNGNLLTVDVNNNIFEERVTAIDDGGIGLTNTIRRLNLVYASRHKLSYGPVNNNQFHVHLELVL
ncbi:sensor histidine kinase [Filimonas effusa]|nr:sensor histidine kinase [Filimonas effusa]